MRKKSQEELGTLVTREMKVMLQDEGLTKEQRFDILAAVMFDAPLKNPILGSFAKSLKAGFELVNAARYRGIEREREWRKNAERKRRKLSYLNGENDTPCTSMSPHDTPCTSMSPHDGLKQNRTEQNISPYKPPKGGKKVPSKISPEDLTAPAKTGKGTPRRTEPTPPRTDPIADYLLGVPDGNWEPTPSGMANAMAEALEQSEAYGRMRANRRNLMRHLIPLAEKNSARLTEWAKEVLDGLDAWTAAWKADDWQYAPGKITKWLADEKYLQPPRKKTAASERVGTGCGDCGIEIA